MLFRLDGVGKEFSGQWLFRDITVQLNPGDRVGLIGRNGAGKTTLFDLIEGRLTPDAGRVLRGRSLQISRVEQIPRLEAGRSLIEEALTVFDDLRRQEAELGELERRMAEGSLSGDVASTYEELRVSFEFSGGYDYPARTEKVLFGLGFSEPDLAMPCSSLSGGQRSRLTLAMALLRPANLLLLDEPTNHLDLRGVLWLSRFLVEGQQALVVVSHDREFLDQVTERTWEIEEKQLFDYSASFSRSRVLREEQRRLRRQAFERQREWKRRTEEFIRRNIAGQKTRQAQARRKRLEKEVWIQEPSEERRALTFNIPEAPREGSTVLEIREGRIGYPDRVLFEGVHLRVRRGQRLGILGGNGSGKTTLIRTALGRIPLLGGELRWGANVNPAYFAQESRFESDHQTVLGVLAAIHPQWTDEEIRSFVARFGFRGEDVLKDPAGLSGGERSRLALAQLFSRPSNALFLDEPTNHLDIASREILEEALRSYRGALIVVSHDLYFLRRVVEDFFLIEDGALRALDNLGDLRVLFPDRPGAGSETDRSWEGPSKSPVPTRSLKPELSKNERMRLERRFGELEARIQALERRRMAIEEDIRKTSDHTHLHRISCAYQDLEEELGRLYRSWEELGARLESP
jgi:ATP-binding cassette, subfamily F, member 3